MEVYTITGMNVNKEYSINPTNELSRRATKLYTSLGKARKAMEEIASRYRECLPEDRDSADKIVCVNFGLRVPDRLGEIGRLEVFWSEDSDYIQEKVWILEKHKLRT